MDKETKNQIEQEKAEEGHDFSKIINAAGTTKNVASKAKGIIDGIVNDAMEMLNHEGGNGGQQQGGGGQGRDPLSEEEREALDKLVEEQKAKEQAQNNEISEDKIESQGQSYIKGNTIDFKMAQNSEQGQNVDPHTYTNGMTPQYQSTEHPEMNNTESQSESMGQSQSVSYEQSSEQSQSM